jgi:murein DD-endopeptidase MepM/ murein hydrolase activator NlpD
VKLVAFCAVLLLILLVVTCAPLFAIVPPMAVYGVSSPVGYRVKPMGGGEEALHRGADLVGPKGAAVMAAAPGVVVEHWLVPGWHGGKLYSGHPVYGGMVLISHGGGVYTLYGHLGATYVHEGMRVEAGRVIGRQGSTGMATGEHLHFELIANPLLFFGSPLGMDSRARKELLR